MVCDLHSVLLILGFVLISTLVFPTMLEDIINRADKWGDGEVGRIEPFTEIHNVSPGNLH